MVGYGAALKICGGGAPVAGPSVARVHNAAASSAACLPQLDHTHINAGKADQQFCLHFFFGKYQSWIFSHKFKFEIKYMSIEYIAIAVLT